MVGRPQGYKSLYMMKTKACRALSTEKALYRNKHKNKALITFSLLISIARHSSTAWLNFVQKVPLEGGKSLYLCVIPIYSRNRHEVRGGFPFPF